MIPRKIPMMHPNPGYWEGAALDARGKWPPHTPGHKMRPPIYKCHSGREVPVSFMVRGEYGISGETGRAHDRTDSMRAKRGQLFVSCLCLSDVPGSQPCDWDDLHQLHRHVPRHMQLLMQCRIYW